jgi:hypothetical protein
MTTILIVDDEDAVRSVVRDMLEPGGAYTLLDTGDPQHALRLARAQPIHLVITDVVMPLMKGTELAARMQTMSPSTKILLMSAYTMSEVTGTGWAFISKPFSMQALNDKVRQILGQRSPFARPSRPA